MNNRRKVIGLMSGTSCDGIDACLVDIIGSGIETKVNLLAFETYPYSDEIRKLVLDACQPETGTVDRICHLNFLIGRLFANSAKMIAEKAGVPLTDVDIIGSHGQTIYHIPDIPPLIKGDLGGLSRSTLQIGEPCVIAQETGVTTVADFRTRDIAAGGQGAPLVPYADFILFRSNTGGRAIQNIGGIANVTFLPSACNLKDLIAFDTGPGNVIIDRITEIITNGKLKFDVDGKLATSGRINDALLDQLLSHPYFSKQPPKTTGREDFGIQFSDKLYSEAKQPASGGLSDADILTTVTAFTARTIAESYKRFILSQYEITEVILSGGGSRNLFLVELLKGYLSPAKVRMVDEFGIPGNAKEAIAFAILANETISGNPNNVPSATGAREAVILGKIAPSMQISKPRIVK